MSNKKRRTRKKRLAAAQERREAAKRRTAAVRHGDTRLVVQSGTTEGYDVEMIRDFLDHLLLELRTQHFENLQARRALQEHSCLVEAMRVAQQATPELSDQFDKYINKYHAALIAANSVDYRNATEAEIREAWTSFLNTQIERRDEQIQHLEALQELFDEALLCAKVPLGITPEGQPVQPIKRWSVRKLLDNGQQSPDIEPSLSIDGEHYFHSSEFAQTLASADVIFAVNERFRKPLLVFGRDDLEAIAKSGVGDNKRIAKVPVGNSTELRKLTAAVAKVKGRHDYQGSDNELEH